MSGHRCRWFGHRWMPSVAMSGHLLGIECRRCRARWWANGPDPQETNQ